MMFDDGHEFFRALLIGIPLGLAMWVLIIGLSLLLAGLVH